MPRKKIDDYGCTIWLNCDVLFPTKYDLVDEDVALFTVKICIIQKVYVLMACMRGEVDFQSSFCALGLWWGWIIFKKI